MKKYIMFLAGVVISAGSMHGSSGQRAIMSAVDEQNMTKAIRKANIPRVEQLVKTRMCTQAQRNFFLAQAQSKISMSKRERVIEMIKGYGLVSIPAFMFTAANCCSMPIDLNNPFIVAGACVLGVVGTAKVMNAAYQNSLQAICDCLRMGFNSHVDNKHTNG